MKFSCKMHEPWAHKEKAFVWIGLIMKIVLMDYDRKSIIVMIFQTI